jgi:uncharacterized membrane protein YbhN (UPF0104 family)
MTRRTTTLLAGTVVAVILLALLFGLSDVAELKRRAHEIRWGFVVAAAVVALFSHACIGLCQHALLAALGRRMPAELVVKVSLVGSVVSRILRSGGASGLAFNTWFFGRLGVSPQLVASMVLGQLLLTNAVFAALAVLGFVGLVVAPLMGAPPPPQGLVIGNAIVAGVLSVGFVAAWVTLGSERLRAPWSRRIERIVESLGRRFKRPGAGTKARELFDEAATAVAGLVAGSRASWAAWGWATARVAASLAALWLCAIAADVRVSAAGIILAYVLGKMAGTLSLVPAGIGLIEGSLAGTLHAVGAPLEAAVLAALLNRVAYHVVPLAVALVIFGPLARRAAHQAANADSLISK